MAFFQFSHLVSVFHQECERAVACCHVCFLKIRIFVCFKRGRRECCPHGGPLARAFVLGVNAGWDHFVAQSCTITSSIFKPLRIHLGEILPGPALTFLQVAALIATAKHLRIANSGGQAPVRKRLSQIW